jgi:hypothetical protein
VIYDHDRFRARQTLMEYLNRIGIHSIGWYGNWEYSGMEEAMMQGKLAIEYQNST